ncbi:serine hydrolase [uncultured Clostridium sp.]|uniref:serine hydrolase n=1 Tax=uncultured Clostridium sp. TaxID=59620 RepID=UPI0025F7B766|nr:serine hydrolase [uncultured Clostridium sp.]
MEMDAVKLEKEIINLCSRVSGSKSVIVENMRTGEKIEINRNEIFPAASLIKLPILLTLFSMAEKGQIVLETRVEVTKDCHVGGFGVLKDLENGLNPTLRDLAVLMITLSDNVATNLLIDMIGMPEINCEITSLGLNDTALRRKMMDAEAKEAGLDNDTSAADIRRILKAVLKSPFREEILDILFRQQCNNKLPVFMGEEIRFAHKTGDLPGVEHDAGIICANGEEIIVVVLTKDLADNKEGIWLNQEIGKLLHRNLY